MFRYLTIALFAFSASVLSAQTFILTSPALPRTGDAVTVRIGGTWPNTCPPLGSRFTRTGNQIRIDVSAYCVTGNAASTPTAWSEQLLIGALQEGTYSVQLVIDDRVNNKVVTETAIFAVEEPGTRERILLPTYARNPITGAGGSTFTVRLIGYYNGELPIYPMQGAAASFREELVLLTGGKRILLAEEPGSANVLGAGRFMIMPKADSNRIELGYTLQSFDAAGAFREQWTSLPVVREGAFKSGTFNVVGVPLRGSTYRHTLRIYHLGAPGGGEVDVAFHHQEPPYRVKSTPLKIDARQGIDLSYPSFAQVGFSALLGPQDLEPASQDDMMRVEITPTRPGLYWAFVSMTDNVSQHVTTIQPQ